MIGCRSILLLPILTFDETVLRASFGYIFDVRWLGPYESIVSILWKFVRMNGLAGHVLAGQLRSEPIDPYEGVSASQVGFDVKRVSRLLGIPQKFVRRGLGPRSGNRMLTPHLRHCPRCMYSGYHSVVHQLFRVRKCPAHREWLEDCCRSCGHVTNYRLDAQLLDAPYRCARCRRPYARVGTCLPRSNLLPCKVRVAMTRAYLI